MVPRSCRGYGPRCSVLAVTQENVSTLRWGPPGVIPLTMMDGVVNRQFPNQAAPIIDCLVQQNTFLPYPEMNLSITLKFRKPPEYDLYSFAHSGIGINIDSIVPDLYIAPHA
jgi:hypothetical protein